MKRVSSIILLWALILLGLGFDFSSYDKPRPEPPAFIIGSGQASLGGHCSRR